MHFIETKTKINTNCISSTQKNIKKTIPVTQTRNNESNLQIFKTANNTQFVTKTQIVNNVNQHRYCRNKNKHKL